MFYCKRLEPEDSHIQKALPVIEIADIVPIHTGDNPSFSHLGTNLNWSDLPLWVMLCTSISPLQVRLSKNPVEASKIREWRDKVEFCLV